MRLRRRVGLPVRLAVLGLLWAAAHSFVHALVSGGESGRHAHNAGQGGAVEAYAAAQGQCRAGAVGARRPRLCLPQDT